MRSANTSRRGRALTRLLRWWLPLVLFAAPVAAEQTAPNPHLQAAFGLYESLEYEKARSALGKARQWPSNTVKDRVSIELLEGVLDFESNRPARGRSAFARALALDREAALPLAVSPKVTAVLEQLRARLPPVAKPPEPVVSEPEPVVTEALRLPLAREPVEVVEGESRARPSLRLPVAIGGGVVALGGMLSWGKARSLASRVRDADPSITTQAQLDDTIQRGRTFEKVGWALMGLGAATAVGSFLFFDAPSAGTRATLLPTPEGAHLSLSWSLR